MTEKQKSKLRLIRKRRGLMICDISFLLGHDSPNRVKNIEKGKTAITLDEAIKIAHILDIEIDEIHLREKHEVASTIQRRATIIAKKLAKKAYMNRFKKRLLWLTNLITRNNKNNGEQQ